MEQMAHLRALLSAALNEKKERNPSYSLRAFARTLKVTAPTLSTLLSGRRDVSTKMALHILEYLSSDAHIRAECAQLAEMFRANTTKRRRHVKNYVYLDDAQFRSIRDWQHFAILGLAETKNFRGEPAWIAEKLGISKRKATDSLATLEQLGCLRRVKGKLLASGKSFASSDGKTNFDCRETNRQFLRILQARVDQLSVESRDLTTMVLAGDPERMEQAKKMIRSFQGRLSRFFEGGEKNAVFTLHIGVVPLTGKD